MKYVIVSIVAFVCLVLSACSKEGEMKAPGSAAKVLPGESIVKKNCKVCHAQGINGAPIIGNAKMWEPRLERTLDELTMNAINGFGLMPAKGGKTELSDEEIRFAVEYMISQVKK